MPASHPLFAVPTLPAAVSPDRPTSCAWVDPHPHPHPHSACRPLRRQLYVVCVETRARIGDDLASGSSASTDVDGASTRLAWDELSAEVRRRVAALNVLATICGGAFGQAAREEWQGT